MKKSADNDAKDRGTVEDNIPCKSCQRILIFRPSSAKLILQITKKHAAKNIKLDVRFGGG